MCVLPLTALQSVSILNVLCVGCKHYPVAVSCFVVNSLSDVALFICRDMAECGLIVRGGQCSVIR